MTSPHNWKEQLNKRQEESVKNTEVKKEEEEEEEDDPVISMIKRTGCLEEHYAVIECQYDKKDWRACRSEVSAFRECMVKNAAKAQRK